MTSHSTPSHWVVDLAASSIRTVFPGERWTGGPAGDEDAEHAARLGITPFTHHVAHELTHTLVARALGRAECPILWASAHGLPMPMQADVYEWQYEAVVYYAMLTTPREGRDFGALIDLVNGGVDVGQVARHLRALLRGFNLLGVI